MSAIIQFNIDEALRGKILTMLALAFLDEIFILDVLVAGLTEEPGSKHSQVRTVFSLVEECRGLTLIGREVHSVAPPALLICHNEPAWAKTQWVFACSSLVLYGIKGIVGFHARKGSIIGAPMP